MPAEVILKASLFKHWNYEEKIQPVKAEYLFQELVCILEGRGVPVAQVSDAARVATSQLLAVQYNGSFVHL